MDPDGNRLQNSCSPRHWGHSTMHRVPPVSGTKTTLCKVLLYTCTCIMCVGHELKASLTLATYSVV